jgi:hypothetical protein
MQFLGSPFYCHRNAKIFCGTKKISLVFFFFFFFFHLCGYLFCRTMSAGNSQRMVQPRTEEVRAASLAKMEIKQAIPERNVLRADVMVVPLDYIVEIIRDNHWGYLYNCACTVYPKLVREFYGYLEVI